MRLFAFAAASLLTAATALPAPVLAQDGAARQKREPTAAQMAARERMRKCAGEWKEAKAKGATAGQKWPQYWSRCNARLKGNQA